ncbi:MAG TPA: PAS domain S-box protein [Syntrophales bacterium]|nr:PAS domain S-box protein [Syntrophales bacterium]
MYCVPSPKRPKKNSVSRRRKPEKSEKNGCSTDAAQCMDRNCVLLSRIMDTTPAGILVVNREGRIQFANRRAEQVLELSRKGLNGGGYAKPAWKMTDGAGNRLPENELPFYRVMSQQAAVYDIRHAVEWPDGRRVFLSVNAAPLLEHPGEIREIVMTFEDITRQIAFDDALQESEARFRAIFDTAQDAIFMKDQSLRYIMVNPGTEKLLGRPAADVIGKKMMDILGEDTARTIESIEKRVLNGEIVKQEYPLCMNGSVKVFEAIKTPIRNGSNRVVGICGVSRDITDARKWRRELEESYDKLRKTMKGTIQAMERTMEMRDPYTAGHQQRVAGLACAMAHKMDLGRDQIEGIYLASVIHDIGKIYIPAEILNKPCKLNEIEFVIVRTHPQVGYDILKSVDFPWPIARIIYQHHERLDGSGYPEGITGSEILIEAKILAVADIVESMASHRPYRPAMGIDKAAEEILARRGHLYDPDAVDACRKLILEDNFRFD